MAGELLLINPSSRKKARKSRGRTKARRAKARKSRTSITVRSNPIRARRRRTRMRFRRNPNGGGGIVNQVIGNVKEGAIGAAGAIATKAALSFLPLPENLKSGPLGSLVTAVAGVLIGSAVGKFASPSVGRTMAQGAVTIAVFDLLKSQLAGKVPGLSGDLDYMGAYSEMGGVDYMGANEGLLGNDGLLGAYSDMNGYENPSPVSFDTATL